MKAVIVGSFGDLKTIYSAIRAVIRAGHEVIQPTVEHINASIACAEADSGGKGDTEETVKLRARLMKEYFEFIKECDVIYVANIKQGKTYVGIGTAIDVGYAYALGKKIVFLRNPANSNMKSMKYLSEVSM
jgi:nucleoside 2-deoxyribosyltransferase